MRTTRYWALMALPVMLSACGGGDEDGAEMEAGGDTTAMTAPAPDTMGQAGGAQGAGMPMNVTMQAVGNSNAGGSATVTGAGQQTQVMVQLTGLTEGPHAGHIHQGTCESLGQVVQPLQEVSAGADGSATATSTVTIDANTLMNGQHVISYHASGGSNPGPSVVCGQIQQHAM